MFADKKCRVGETGIQRMSRVGETGVGEMGIGETGAGEMGVGEMRPNHMYTMKTRTTMKTGPSTIMTCLTLKF